MRWSVVVGLLVAGCGPQVQIDEPDGQVGVPDARPTVDGGPIIDARPTIDGRPLVDAGGSATCDNYRCDVTFTFPSASATSVELRGDFSPGGWETGIPMTGSGGTFTTTVRLPHGRKFQYKYVVDGAGWYVDPDSSIPQVPDGYSGYNSLRDVDCGCTATPFDWRDGIMYFVFTDRFRDGDSTNNWPASGVTESAAQYNGGDLAGVLAKIEEGYFTDLGVNVLWLSAPIDNTSAAGRGMGDDSHMYSAYHGYWPSDLTAPEEHAGDLDLLREVIDAAHARGIKVILDYVMNHVYIDSPVYAAHPEWFYPNEYYGHDCICGGGCSWDNWPENERCWFTSYLPDFDFTNSYARAFSVENAIEWALLGIDGFRLDAVKHINMSWITDLRSRLRSEAEWGSTAFYLIGETYTGQHGTIANYIDPATKLDGQFDFPLRAQIVSSILTRTSTMTNLKNFLDDPANMWPAGAVMGTFVGNHDVPRSILFAEDSPWWTDPWASGKNCNWMYQPSDPPSSANPYQRLAVAYALLMTIPGIPLIYYGDEIGMTGCGDPDNRRMMQWSGENPQQILLRQTIAKLTHIRAAHSPLRRGTRNWLGDSSDVYVYKMVEGSDEVYVALNRGDSAQNAVNLPPGSYTDLVAETTVTAPLTIPPRSFYILVQP